VASGEHLPGGDRDLSGLDVFETGSFTASPMPSSDQAPLPAAQDDWLAVALRELDASTPAPSGRPLSTDAYASLVTTKPGPVMATSLAAQATGCAPVVGPNTVSSQSARERQERARAAATPAAREFLERDARFAEQRGRATYEQALAAARKAYAGFGPYSAAPVPPAHQHTAVPHPNLRVMTSDSASGQTIPFEPVRCADRVNRPA
jgi:hypothetical protein